MTTLTQDWRTLPAGRELDALVAEAMEPRSSLPTPTAHEARLRAWGPDPKKWTWYSVNGMDSPGGWWYAELGTDCPGGDHEPIVWRLNSDREPSYSIADAWQVVEPMRARGFFFSLDADLATSAPWRCEFDPIHTGRVGKAYAETPALAIVRAALSAVEVQHAV